MVKRVSKANVFGALFVFRPNYTNGRDWSLMWKDCAGKSIYVEVDYKKYILYYKEELTYEYLTKTADERALEIWQKVSALQNMSHLQTLPFAMN